MWISAVVAVALFTSVSSAGEAVSVGKVKSINADKKEFVLADSNNKDWTIALGGNVVINRDGKESKNDLEVGDVISVCYDKGTFTWTARYILVQAGLNKDCELVSGAIKGYDVDKKQLAFTDEQGKDWDFAMGDAKLQVNNEKSKVEDVKIGDHAVAIVAKNGDKMALKAIMVTRK
jgi:hypothetical protein